MWMPAPGLSAKSYAVPASADTDPAGCNGTTAAQAADDHNAADAALGDR
jgi:hypothetical protein